MPDIPADLTGFNSTLVQLKTAARKSAAPVDASFQFHIGSIKNALMLIRPP